MEDPGERRARLKALREAAQNAGELDADQAEPELEKPVLKFRNYQVQDKKHIQHEQVPAAQPPKFVEPVPAQQPEQAPQEELLVNIAPKKANWDLKRDIEAKLEKLERRTQRAVVEIMQEDERKRLESEGIQD